ncbi:Hypothetical protein A7982_03304 [Minicystis rosea]|nr:Hypothetical protein A7982_03304 [Minicystis rosea]
MGVVELQHHLRSAAAFDEGGRRRLHGSACVGEVVEVRARDLEPGTATRAAARAPAAARSRARRAAVRFGVAGATPDHRCQTGEGDEVRNAHSFASSRFASAGEDPCATAAGAWLKSR